MSSCCPHDEKQFQNRNLILKEALRLKDPPDNYPGLFATRRCAPSDNSAIVGIETSSRKLQPISLPSGTVLFKNVASPRQFWQRLFVASRAGSPSIDLRHRDPSIVTARDFGFRDLWFLVPEGFIQHDVFAIG